MTLDALTIKKPEDIFSADSLLDDLFIINLIEESRSAYHISEIVVTLNKSTP